MRLSAASVPLTEITRDLAHHRIPSRRGRTGLVPGSPHGGADPLHGRARRLTAAPVPLTERPGGARARLPAPAAPLRRCRQGARARPFRHGGLRGGAARPAAAEGQRRGPGGRQTEEEEGEGQGPDPGADREQQEAGGGEEARAGQADPGAGGLREDAGEAANGADPEESIENTQAASGGLQQALGYSD